MSWLRLVAAVPLIAISILGAGSLTARGEDRPPPPAKPAAGCPHSAFRVVIDVGHTLEVPGAISARGVPEYAFNLNNSPMTSSGRLSMPVSTRPSS
jgi:N-acetylmuramoyl-L-alanine amidase